MLVTKETLLKVQTKKLKKADKVRYDKITQDILIVSELIEEIDKIKKEGDKMTKKEIIQELLFGYSRIYISIKEDLEGVFVDTIKRDDIEITYSLENNETLGIKDTITKDNIHLYYEFMRDDDLRKFIIKLENEFSDNQDEELMDIIDLLENQLQRLNIDKKL